ncbi:hypothetical protein DFH27DRAFT_474694 [Peziza echinospora]|nr:hypothetical protein DFH27DRAFT_474694 [Peziza echinospora]
MSTTTETPPPPEAPKLVPVADTTLAVPLKLDAFVLNPAVAAGGDTSEKLGSKIAPITQPNYTFLRLSNYVVQNDILDHHDLHNAAPASRNPRLTNLANGKELRHRQGVYLHWSLPRVYRSGMAAADEAPDNRGRDGIPVTPGLDEDKVDRSAPQFRVVPTRWLVIRRLHPGTAVPPQAKTKIPEIQAWVVESDRLRDIKYIPQEVDLQTDVSPYMTSETDGGVSINRQAEVFIGQKYPAEEWIEVGDQTPDGKKVERAPVSLLTGGNMLFADYQPHNSNVFSIIDNFCYPNPLWRSGLDDPDVPQYLYLSEAKASYYVVGWHPKAKDDPFYGASVDRAARLAASQMELKLKTAEVSKSWTDNKAADNASQILCHGAMYEVVWNVGKAPEKVPADDASKQLHDHVPISVGTTAIDSLLAYIHGHEQTDMQKLLAAILKIQALLLERDDTVDAQRQATDLMYNYNYSAESGGTKWYFGGSEKAGQPAKPPTQAMVDTLARMNDIQLHLDQVERAITASRWEMFSLWWKYISDNVLRRAKDQLTSDLAELQANGQLASDKLGAPTAEQKKYLALAKKEVQPTFFQQLDPTVMVAGIDHGWPEDFMELLQVRLAEQVTGWGDAATKHNGVDWGALVAAGGAKTKGVLEKLPDSLKKTARALVAEFFALMPDAGGKDPAVTVPGGRALPQYHDQAGVQVPADQVDKAATLRDHWGKTQPWFPLFVEWEVEYYHVPIGEWELAERRTEGDVALNKLRYALKEDKPLVEKRIDDRRTCSGRVLLLPQPSFSLKAKVDEVIDNTPRDLLKLTDDELARLRTQLRSLKLLSSPLSGLTDQLATRAQGTHLKPNIRAAGQALKPLADAYDENAGWRDDQFTWMGTETDLTPFATLVRSDKKHSIFKPATHGQFRFTKFNIIDKFGQAIHAIDPRWHPESKPPAPVYPYISEFYAPLPIQVTIPLIDPTKPADPTVPRRTIWAPNIIDADKHADEPHSEFVQLPVHINQTARMNAFFVKRDADGQTWVPQSEWENPIWGWLVLNYAQHGLQIFLPDGRFYREIRLGGFTGATVGEKWLPFAPPKGGAQDAAASTAQIDALIAKLDNADNLQEFIDMINGALRKAPPAPETYAQFLNSIVGKPLALVNVGWSLELAEPEYASEATVENQVPQPVCLLQHQTDEIKPKLIPRYTFPFKLGDAERTYDGLVGYFDTLDKLDGKGNNLKLDKIHTYFESDKKSWTELVTPAKYPSLQTYYHDLMRYDSGQQQWVPIPTQTLTQQRLKEIKAFGVVMDPFTPVHAYSGILPNKELRLPSWTWQEGIARMTAFFRVGPIIQPHDVEPYQAGFRLYGNYTIGDNKVPADAKGIHKGVVVPGISARDGWRWLQPYFIDKEEEKKPVEKPKWLDSKETAYMPLLVQPNMGLALEDGPYMALEGYLQLQKPIVRP